MHVYVHTCKRSCLCCIRAALNERKPCKIIFVTGTQIKALPSPIWVISSCQRQCKSLCSLSFSSSLNQAFQIWLEISLRWTYTNETLMKSCAALLAQNFICTFLSLDTQEKSRKCWAHISRQDHLGQLQTYGTKGWINCNLSVLAESTESISGDAIPADMLDMKYFSKLLLWTFFADVTRIWQIIEWLVGYIFTPFAVFILTPSFLLYVDRIKLHQTVHKMRV